MSALETIFAKSIAFFETAQGDAFIWKGQSWQCSAAAIDEGEDRFNVGSSIRRSVLLEAHIIQFDEAGLGAPQVRDPIIFQGREYRLESKRTDNVTLKLEIVTTAAA